MRGHRGLLAATAVLAVSGGIAGVGAAGASEEQADVTVRAHDVEFVWENPDVTVDVGDTVTWHTGASPAGHNVKANNDVPADPEWKNFLEPGPGEYTPAPPNSEFTYTFDAPGTYAFVCMLHSNTMTGTVTVSDGGEPTETPTTTPSSTPSSTPSATPTTQPTAQPTTSPQPTATPDDHTNTPPPGGSASSDTVKPRISSTSVKGLRRAVRVRFRLSETSTVTIQIKKRGSRKVLRSVRVNARAGSRSVTVRSRKLRKGRYTVELRARDAMGNRSALAKKSVRLRK